MIIGKKGFFDTGKMFGNKKEEKTIEEKIGLNDSADHFVLLLIGKMNELNDSLEYINSRLKVAHEGDKIDNDLMHDIVELAQRLDTLNKVWDEIHRLAEKMSNNSKYNSNLKKFDPIFYILSPMNKSQNNLFLPHKIHDDFKSLRTLKIQFREFTKTLEERKKILLDIEVYLRSNRP